MRGTVSWAVWAVFAFAFLGAKLVCFPDTTKSSFPSNRGLSIANGKQSGRSDDDSMLVTTDDDVQSRKSSDSRKSGTSSSSSSTSSRSSSTNASTKPASSSSNPSPAPVSPRSHSSKSSSSTATASSNLTTTNDLGNTTASNDEVEPTFSEWTFHNETAADEAQKYNVSVANTTKFLPPEIEQTDSWTFAVLAIFTVLGLVLVSVTVYRNYRDRTKRDSYEEIANVVV